MVNQSKSKMALSKIDAEIEQVDQEKYLRQATNYYQALEKPLKYGPVIETMDQLITALHREFESNYVNIEMVNHLMLSYKSNPKEWRKYAKFDRYTYTRNLVDAGNGKFNLLILCWGEGHGSSVHDHADSHCFMKMLKGDLREKRYEYPNRPNNTVSKNTSHPHSHEGGYRHSGAGSRSARRRLAVNDVAYINDNLGLHRGGRIQVMPTPPFPCTSIVHPFDTCSVFQDNCKKTTAKVTFWSKYGVRTKLNEQ
ncbi:GL17444 [Drosophila persimilis]|uniref:Cysteine dioxygenase n=1 Tax=Drosophila persimilis TaxID=7234 RepID=B4GH14_DROPE|nr:GL17444 [Drosophila persimilis]